MKQRKPAYYYCLPGAGSAGAIEVGALDACFNVHRLDKPLGITGVSVGALVAVKAALAIVTGEWDHWAEIRRVFMSVQDGDIFDYEPLDCLGFSAGFIDAVVTGDPSVYDPTPLARLIERFTPDADLEQLLEAGRKGTFELQIVATNLNTSAARVFTNATLRTPADVRRAVLASAAAPIYMPPVMIDGVPFVDGGVTDNNPIGWVQRSNMMSRVTDVVILDPTEAVHSGEWPGGLPGITDLLMKTLSILMHGAQEDDLRTAHLTRIIQRLRARLPDDEFEAMVGLPPSHPIWTRLNQTRRAIANIIELSQCWAPRHISAFEFKQPAMRDMALDGFAKAATFEHLETLAAKVSGEVS